MIEVVSATRLSREEFEALSPLGRSKLRLSFDDKRLIWNVAYNNNSGLPEIYNKRIEALDLSEILIFVHDDVWIEDFFLVDRLTQALSEYDVIAVAGNRRKQPYPRQPSWLFKEISNGQFVKDEDKNLSGAVAHGPCPYSDVTRYGKVPKTCVLLDGVFLAAKKKVLTSKGVKFDTQFKFHFYDLDFCRTARNKKLRLGTWPISITHASGGSFGSPEWQSMYEVYLAKWRE